MKFIEDLAFGKSWEIKLLEHLNYDTYIQTEGLIKDYDIEITKDNIKTKYEVKVDRMAYNTGNIVIEYECKNKPSGINTTTADYWAIFEYQPNDYELYLIPTQHLDKLINNREYIRFVKGGDNYGSKMFLFNKNIFSKYKIKIYSI